MTLMKQKFKALLEHSVPSALYETVRHTHHEVAGLVRKFLCPFIRLKTLVFLSFYRRDLEAFLGRIFSPDELGMLPDSRTLLKHLTRAKCEIFYFLIARKQLLRLGKRLGNRHGVANLPKSIRPSNFKFSKRRLRILYISGVFPSVEHGGGLRLFDILSELSERHHVELYTSFSESQDLVSLELLKRKLEFGSYPLQQKTH